MKEKVRQISSLTEVRKSVIEERGGRCLGCDCNPGFKVTNSTGVVVQDSPSTSHGLKPDNMGVRVSCDATVEFHRPYKGGQSHEDCRSRKHLLARGK